METIATKIKVATLQLAVATLLCGCSTTYHAPDATKLKASVKKLHQTISKSHDTAKKAKEKHKEVEQAANTLLEDSLDLDGKIEELSKNAPPELQPQIAEIKKLQSGRKEHEFILQQKVEEERILHEQLAKDNAEVVTAETDVHRNGDQYLKDAEAMATRATEDNKKLSSQLWKQKLLSGLGITGAIVFVICLVAGFIMWKLGKLAIKL